MPIKIREIKSKQTHWLIKCLAQATKLLWKEPIFYLDSEYNAELKLALEKSKRIEDEIDELSDIDLSLDWGCERTIDKKTGFNAVKKSGDFNPWYAGSLTLDELVSALENLYTFHVSFSEPSNNDDLAFLHYYECVEKIFTDKKPKPKYVHTPDTFWGQIHIDVRENAESRFNSGHYADAVESALKYLNSRIKEIVKKEIGVELDGSDLMNRAFSIHNPIITLDDLKTETGKNIQVGYMQIFSGSMTGIRNPKAHNNIQIDKVQAIHLLFLVSLLATKLDGKRTVQIPKRLKG